MDSKIEFDISKKHPCIVNGCKIPAGAYQEYCDKHLEMVISR